MPRLKIMTWNVLYKEKADNVLALVKELNPDILCCQEITTDSYINPGRDVPAEISQAMNGEYKYFEVLALLDNHPASMGNAIISKFPIVQGRSVLLQKGGADINYSAQNRGYLEAGIKVGNDILTIGTTHLSYVDWFVETEARTKEADKLLDFIKGNDRKYVIMGDFNSAPNSSTIKKMETRLKAVGPDNKQPTFSTKPFVHNDFSVNKLEWRLDYIFATPDIKVLSSEIIKTDFSDHLPILAEIEI
ncbi:MAG: endonuclease/exonuclease/phosphatase family protein [Candidatus Saccharimonadales bacterium]|jgi:endonuclease/exonuclease/phosphatase family metal-dependent hydrolase